MGCKNCSYKGSFNGLQQHLRSKPTCYNSYSQDELNNFINILKDNRKIIKSNQYQKRKKQKTMVN